MKKALLFLLMTCYTGVVWANFNDGEKAFKEQHWVIAYNEFKPLVENDVRAQYYMGYLTLNGLGTIKNEKKAIEYFNKAAEQNSDMAQAMLGYLYAEGIGVKKNKKKSLELYEQAATKGNGDALLNLGVMYYTGDGVQKDVNQAIELLSKVSTTDKPIAAKYLGDIYFNDTTVQDYQKAFDYYFISARADDIASYHILGYMFQKGLHVKENINDAIKFYTYAASKGYTPSQYALGAIYANGEGVVRDVYKAHAYLTMAATAGMKEAEKAKKQLEEDMSLSERDKASRAMISVQNEDLNAVSTPINDDTKVKTPTATKKTRTTIRRRRR